MKNLPTTSLPAGVKDTLPEEAEQIASACASVTEVFKSSGFERVSTPLIEYLDVLSPGLDQNLDNTAIKFIEYSTGKVMAIRPDVTPQIARLVSTRLKDKPLPIKLFYIENVMRMNRGSEDKTVCETIQAGTELITKEAGPETDAEIIITAIEALKKTGIKDFKVDLADIGFIRSIFARIEASTESKKDIEKFIALKDTNGLSRAIDKAGGVTEDDKELLLSITTLYGEVEVIEAAEKLKGTKNALGNLKKVVEILTEKGYGEAITIDLGEVRGFDYYTGIIFEGFAEGYGKALLGGGRYDGLLTKYGMEAKSTGFAIDVENVVELLQTR
ncbi:MAG: ATP phosphoribosyltransferase regulatory subunit, partial [Deltaproteobacteria bacterium]|nr:ATP phosphoribosyltransferase regulatory subunit [Deltaproteobacteria bacterium]